MANIPKAFFFYLTWCFPDLDNSFIKSDLFSFPRGQSFYFFSHSNKADREAPKYEINEGDYKNFFSNPYNISFSAVNDFDVNKIDSAGFNILNNFNYQKRGVHFFNSDIYLTVSIFVLVSTSPLLKLFSPHF